MTEINEELIQFSALGWACCPTVRAKCGDVGKVGAGKRMAKGCGGGRVRGCERVVSGRLAEAGRALAL